MYYLILDVFYILVIYLHWIKMFWDSMPETLCIMWLDYVPIAIYIYVLAHCSFFINEKPDVFPIT